MGRFRVQVDQLTDAVGEAEAAKEALDEARDETTRLTERMYDEPALVWAATAPHIHEFAERWRKEFELIGQMVTSMNDALKDAAEAYRAADSDLAAVFRQLTPDAVAPGPRTSSADSIDRPGLRTASADSVDRPSS
jgi:flavin-binding protein dodecin